jgi:hypothetical protein
MSDRYICSHCGQSHEGLPSDWAFTLPDEIHALPYLDRYARVRHNADLCTLDESRHFLRALLPLPLNEGQGEGSFHWGLWVEVDRPLHDLYLRSWEEDISGQPRVPGRIANEIAVYGDTLGLAVDIQFMPGTDRPTLWLPAGTTHALALEQSMGISARRHHDILTGLGHFELDDDEAD